MSEGRRPGEATPFQRGFFAERDELVGARWWQEHVSGSAAAAGTVGVDRRQLVTWFGGIVGGWVLLSWLIHQAGRDHGGYGYGHGSDDDDVSSMDALVLQRSQGWNVGSVNSRLAYAGATAHDEAGGMGWMEDLPYLTGKLAPSNPALVPYYVSTLFQVVAAADFRNGLMPIHMPQMDVARARGRALGDLFAGVGARSPSDTALLVDVAGPDAVAVAAGLAPRFDPVFLFDNWPHPRGVVLSHEVVAAALYYLPSFASARSARPAGAPPAFVIDSRRLAPYRDESEAFDNRYLARLPSADGFKRLGIAHLLYVTDGLRAFEADDLNDDFVALAQAGIDVKTVALSEFLPPAKTDATATTAPSYSYAGGGTHAHYWFWHSYGWYGAPAPRPAPGLIRAAAVPAPAPPVAPGAAYRPAPRTTIFSSRAVGGMAGFGKQKPSGFGRVSVSSSGRVSIGRSGSLGRSRFSFGG